MKPIFSLACSPGSTAISKREPKGAAQCLDAAARGPLGFETFQSGERLLSADSQSRECRIEVRARDCLGLGATGGQKVSQAAYECVPRPGRIERLYWKSLYVLGPLRAGAKRSIG